jgi:hypothetical protein
MHKKKKKKKKKKKRRRRRRRRKRSHLIHASFPSRQPLGMISSTTPSRHRRTSDVPCSSQTPARF